MVDYQRLQDISISQRHELDQLMKSGFDAYERMAIEDIVSQLQADEMILIGAMDSTSLVGFAILYYLPRSGDLYLPYFAIHPEYRNDGLGSKFFTYLQDYGTNQTTASRLVWEVKTPDTDDPQTLDQRRINFYTRLGGTIVDFAPEYRVPYKESTYAYLIVTSPLKKTTTALSRETVIDWIRDIYAIYYPEATALRDQVIATIQSPDET